MVAVGEVVVMPGGELVTMAVGPLVCAMTEEAATAAARRPIFPVRGIGVDGTLSGFDRYN